MVLEANIKKVDEGYIVYTTGYGYRSKVYLLLKEALEAVAKFFDYDSAIEITVTDKRTATKDWL